MTGIDLTPANAAARDAIWRNATRDVTGSIDRPTADRLAARAVRAATPLIAAAVREQVAQQIEDLIPGAEQRIEKWTVAQRPDQILKFKVVIDVVRHTAGIARGGES